MKKDFDEWLLTQEKASEQHFKVGGIFYMKRLYRGVTEFMNELAHAIVYYVKRFLQQVEGDLTVIKRKLEKNFK